MVVTGWNNGTKRLTGAGYGLRITENDRNVFFQRSWSSVIVDLPNGTTVNPNLSASFWKTGPRKCIELRNAQIGRWMIQNGLAPWQKNNPPIFNLIQLAGNRFRLT
jgi:hypothetical protein